MLTDGIKALCWRRKEPAEVARTSFLDAFLGRRPRGRPKTRWRDTVSRLAWERLGVPPEELEGGTRLPEKGPTTGTIIGAIIGVIIILAIIGTAITMYRKHRSKISGDGPPKYKPPPPNKNNSSASNREMTVIRPDNPSPEERPLHSENANNHNAEPVTDLDAYYDDENVDDEAEHYFSAAPSGWDDPGNTEVPPPYMQTHGEDDYAPGPNVNRGDSFISPAMFV